MDGRLFVLREVTDFVPGYFDHTAMEEECVQLSRDGTGYAPAGMYTSLPFQAEPFFGLVPSWNVQTPPGTSAEMFVRVSSGGRWSRWFGFGAWGVYMDRGSREPERDEIASVEGAFLAVADGRAAADMVQIRIQLFSNEEQTKSPAVRLLAVSTNATQKVPGEEHMVERVLKFPTYSCLVRDPAIAGRIASVSTLCMMINRWGRDVLPEEMARISYDTAAGRYSNLAFLCAAVSVYGFDSYIKYSGIGALRNEIWRGRAVAARVSYRAPAVDGQIQQGEHNPLPPVLEGAVADSVGHLVLVCGFVRKEGREHVCLHDPLASSDEQVFRQVSLAQFSKMYTGIAMFMGNDKHYSGRYRPRRKLAKLEVSGDTLRLLYDEKELAPALLSGQELTPCTLCYTLSDGIAYASSAQKRFYYPTMDEAGNMRFDRKLAAGRKLTCYLIAMRGKAWVAEKMFEKSEEQQEESV